MQYAMLIKQIQKLKFLIGLGLKILSSEMRKSKPPASKSTFIFLFHAALPRVFVLYGFIMHPSTLHKTFYSPHTRLRSHSPNIGSEISK